MRFCDLDEIKVCIDRQYENCHGYSGNKKAIYREAILAVKSILHSAKPVDAVEVVRCRECKHRGTDYCIFHIKGEPADEELLRKLDNDFCSYGERKEESRTSPDANRACWEQYLKYMHCNNKMAAKEDGKHENWID